MRREATYIPTRPIATRYADVHELERPDRPRRQRSGRARSRGTAGRQRTIHSSTAGYTVIG